MADYYRGGASLQPRPNDVRIDQGTGLLHPGYGVSVSDRPNGLEKFGGAHRLTQVPAELRIVQRGRNPHRHEIVPARPMTLPEYEQASKQIVLVPV